MGAGTVYIDAVVLASGWMTLSRLFLSVSNVHIKEEAATYAIVVPSRDILFVRGTIPVSGENNQPIKCFTPKKCYYYVR